MFEDRKEKKRLEAWKLFKLPVKITHTVYLCTICYQIKEVIKEMKLYGITDNLVFISYLKGRYGSKKLKTML